MTTIRAEKASVQMPYIKEAKTDKAENDFVPQKNFAGQLNGLTRKFEKEEDGFKEQLKEALERIEQNGYVAEQDLANIRQAQGEVTRNTVELKEINKLLKTALQTGSISERDLERVRTISERNTLEGGEILPVENDVRKISISAGYLAQANAILLELQSKYIELQQLYNEVVRMNLGNSPEVVRALATAAKESLYKDAENQRLQMYSHIASGAVDITGGATKGYMQHQMGKSLQKPTSELNTLDQYKTTLDKQPPATVQASNKPLPTDGPVANQIDKFKAGQFFAKNEDNPKIAKQVDDEAMSHIASVPADHQTVGKHLNEQINTKTTEINTIHSQNLARQGLVDITKQLANDTTNATVSGLQANNTEEKGERDAQQQLSSSTNHSLQEIVQDNREHAKAAMQDADAQLRIRDALMSSSRA